MLHLNPSASCTQLEAMRIALHNEEKKKTLEPKAQTAGSYPGFLSMKHA